PDGYNISFGLYILSTYFWALPCVILWQRLYLLGPEHLMKRRMWPIMTRSFVIMSKVLFLVGLAALVCILLVSVLLFLINALGLNDSVSDFIALSDNEFMRFLIIVFITALTTYLVFLRFSLAICARTIGKRIGLLTSWKLTEKNTMRMFLSFVAIFIPASIATYAILFVYQSIFQFSIFYSGEMLTTSSYIHIFILAPVITLPLSAMCSQCAAFYRHCGGEECPQGL
ncbi:MAG: hypothetical protein P8H03_03120, partial [Emcibacteraceae bacterium]|nr:hypothetical protein [Emcibacteraceae bacterium]